MASERLPLVITPGDPLGIGPEISAKALRSLNLDVVVAGHGPAVERWTGSLPRVDGITPGAGVRLLDTSTLDGPCEVTAIRLAVEACLDGRAAALVTGPIHKARLAAQGFHHPGHTDFLGELCGVHAPVMGFVGGSLRVALVTVHLPLSQVAQAVTQPRVLHTLKTAHEALQRDLGLAEPRLLVCGLNPHAGDGGLLGREELQIIQPAIAQARELGIQAIGPVSSEAAFRIAQRGDADMVVAMYHDQGLAPLKLVDFGQSVNWTLGLPIIRTSVDHGTADDIAGQGVADPRSMLAAITLAQELARSRGLSQRSA